MLGSVSPMLRLGAVGLLSFFIGTRIEPLFERSAGAKPAHAMTVPKTPAMPAKAAAVPAQPKEAAAKPAEVAPAALRLGSAQQPPAAPAVASAPATAPAPATSAPPPAMAALPAAPEPAAPPPEAAPSAETAKPSAESGKDPESDVEFYEMKNMPEVQGEAEPTSPRGRDVDMIDEAASKDADPGEAPASDAKTP